MKIIVFLILFFNILPVHALPIDWHGAFGVDTTLIDNFRRIKSIQDNSTIGSGGTQEVGLASGDQANSSFQTYVFRLNPTMIINDSATFFGELTSGYGRGGRLGDDSTRASQDATLTANNQDRQFGNALYMNNTSTGNEDLAINKMYAEYYSDTATYIIGRHSFNWGLGAVYNSGDDVWDRFSYIRDGVTVKVKLGNFHITPYWAKIANTGSLTRATKIKEMGLSLLYDNYEKDMAFGIHYANKQNSAFEGSIRTDINDPTNTDSTNSTNLGKTDVKITDIYFSKSFGDFSFELEVPILSGELGDLYQNNTSTKYKARAILLESTYKLSETWKLKLHGGNVSGDSGSQSSFEAMFLHPNYQVANLMFRFNTRAVSDPNNINVFDSYITNATYVKLAAQYAGQKWSFDFAGIWAKANEVAKATGSAYNHSTNKIFTSTVAQQDDLGMEFDAGFNYQWNKEISIGGDLGYLMTGDYYAYTNSTSTTNEADDTFMLQLRTAIEF